MTNKQKINQEKNHFLTKLGKKNSKIQNWNFDFFAKLMLILPTVSSPPPPFFLSPLFSACSLPFSQFNSSSFFQSATKEY
jgi:hypothetical protein